MNARRTSYASYSGACALVWSLILLMATRTHDEKKQRTIQLTGAACRLCWLSASIARYLHPRRVA
jgi:hypothetical protein